MLSNHTHERLAALGLAGMAKAFDDQQRQPDVTALTFEQRLGLMIDREATERENKRLIVRLKFASLRQTAIVEDVDLRAPRGIDRAFFAKLADGDWIGRKQNLLITGPTGVGKSWIACALGHKACRDNRSSYIIACQGCSKLLRSPAATDAMRGSSRRYQGSICSSSMIGASPRLPASSVAISSKSSTIDTSADRPSSPARCRSKIGMRSSPTRPSPTPSWIGSSTTPTASHSREIACERSLRSAPILTQPRKPDPTPHAGNDTPAAFVGTGGRLRSECIVAFNRNPWPQSPESASIGAIQEKAALVV